MGLSPPKIPATVEGSPKMAPPMMIFNISAARLQRPMARTRSGLGFGMRGCTTNGLLGVSLKGSFRVGGESAKGNPVCRLRVPTVTMSDNKYYVKYDKDPS